MHVGYVDRQTIETLDNLDALVAAAEAKHPPALAQPRLKSLRVYIVRPDDLHVVRDRIEQRYGEIPSIQFAQAELCRTDLLVEIEGIVEL